MGFRFRKSFKLAPGVRFNFGLKRSSLSLGGRGATLNLSGRGARSTFSLPGTGLSWSSGGGGSRSSGGGGGGGGGGRRMSLRQYEAATRRAEEEQRRVFAQSQVEAEQRRQADLENQWRQIAPLLTPEQYHQACFPRPFEFDVEPPAMPSRDEVMFRALMVAREAEARRSNSQLIVAGLGIVSTVFSGGILAAALDGSAALVGAPVGGVTALVAHLLLKRRVEQAATAQANAAFPVDWQAAETLFAKEQAEYDHARATADAEWQQAEAQRVAWARRLVDGEIEALNEAVSDSLGDIDFAFEARCDVAVIDPSTIYVLLDLPEIEDAIPETKARVLKDGRTTMTKRAKADRCGDYLHLVCGLALQVAWTALGCSPTLQVAHVAGYTQRRQPRTGILRNDFVLEVAVDRSACFRINPTVVDPVQTVTSFQSRIDPKANRELKTLTPPSWAQQLFDFAIEVRA
jgi:hypothetical protein